MIVISCLIGFASKSDKVSTIADYPPKLAMCTPVRFTKGNEGIQVIL